jgi:ribosomal protein S8
MVNKKQPNCYYSAFFSSFKNCLLKKKNNFISYYSKFNYLICTYLYKRNFFSELHILNINNTKYLYITLDVNEGEYLFLNLNNKYRRSRPIYMNVKKLKKLNSFYKMNFLISTSKGILNTKEAITLNVGGVLIFEYY